jgi:ribosomal protein S18 acetylase RimI-like enzyme
MPVPPIAIRLAQPSDETAILDICLRTADRGHDASGHYSDPRLPGLVWALPYVRLCPDNAFVLTRGDEVMGYCVATPDTEAYEERLETEWWARLRVELAGVSPQSADDNQVLAYISAAVRTPKNLTDAYPAHLHINVLPEMQKGGHGSALLRHQLEALAHAGVPGVHLGVDPRNHGVTKFYSKFGFVELFRNPSIVMGIKVTQF